MRKKFNWIWCSAFAAFAMSGCFKDAGDNGLSEVIRPVEPGLYIYSAASSQNQVALQPADIAFRMAILRSEAAKQGKEDNLDQVVVTGVGNLKTLLLGTTTKIEQSDGFYVITYAGGGGMQGFDTFSRLGKVRIRTGGVALEDTDASNPWLVDVDSRSLELTSARTVSLISTGDARVYRKDETGYEITFDGCVAYIQKSISSDWTGNFILTTDKAADLSYSNLKGAVFTLDGEASGDSFWTLNNSSTARFAYKVEEGKYDPSKSYVGLMTEGAETVRLTDPADYNAEAYPSPEVAVKWTFKNLRLSYVVSYNGYDVELIY